MVEGGGTEGTVTLCLRWKSERGEGTLQDLYRLVELGVDFREVNILF